MSDQLLKDWTGTKDSPHSSGDWLISNENLEATNSEDTWLGDYRPARQGLVNSETIQITSVKPISQTARYQ